MASKVVLLVCLALSCIDGSFQAVSSSANTNDLRDILSTIKGRLTPSACDPLDLITQVLVREIEARVAQQAQFDRRITELQNQRTNGRAGMAIAFSAKVRGFHTGLTSGKKVDFQTVVTNIGDGYNGATSTFICPVKGLYQFTVTILAKRTSRVQTQLVAAGVGRMLTYSVGTTSDDGSGTNIVLVALEAGDEVYVGQSSGSQLYDNYSTFNGHLVALMHVRRNKQDC